jgi:hypothetical protein
MVLMAVSCIKDEIDLDNISYKMEWNPKIGIPVAYGNLTLDDLIQKIDSNNTVRQDSEKFLTLVYSNSLISGTAEDLIKISNQNFNEVLLSSSFSLPPMPTQDTIVLNRPAKHTFLFQYGEVIDSVKIKSANMAFNISSTYKHRGTLKITVPKLIKNNKPLEITVDIDKSDGTFSAIQNVDLTGYTLQLDHPNTHDNVISYNFTAKLVNSGAGINVGDRIAIEVDILNMTFSSIFGYLGQRQLLNIRSQFSMPLFKNTSYPDMKFANPLIKIRSANSFGMPATVELYDVKASNDNISESVLLTFTPGTNPFNISYPVTMGTLARDTTFLSNKNTNLNAALSIGPNKIDYGIKSFSNPAGKVSNYVMDTSSVYVDMDVELPLEMTMNKIAFVDTMEIDISDMVSKSESIKSLLLHCSFENGLPADLNLQVYFLDENQNPIDTLFSPSADNTIKSGAIDQQGKVIQSTNKTIDIVFTTSQLNNLTNIRHAIINAEVATANGGSTFVKFYSNNTIKVQFGIQTEFEIKEN